MPDPVLALDNTRVSVAPGTQARVTVTITNVGPVVEGYQLSVVGDGPSRWATVLPAEVSVLPEQDSKVTVVFSPPSGAMAPSGTWPFGVMARSTVDANVSAVVEGDIEITQVFGMQAKLTPVTSAGRWRGRHVVQLSNYGNTPARLQLRASDPDAALGFMIRPDTVDLPLNGRATARLWVRARRPFLRGTPVRVPFTVVGERVDAGPAAGPLPYGATPDRPTADGALNQKPILSKGFVTLVSLLLAGLIGLVAVLFFVDPGAKDRLPELTPGKPERPVGLRAAPVDDQSIRLSWRQQPGVEKYQIKVKKNNLVERTVEAAPGDNTVVPGLEADTTYCFDLIAQRGTEQSEPAPVCATTDESPSPSPTPPSDTPTPTPTPTPTKNPDLVGMYVAVVAAYRSGIRDVVVEDEQFRWEAASFTVEVLDLGLYTVEPNPFAAGTNRLLIVTPVVGDDSEAQGACTNALNAEVIRNGNKINLTCDVVRIVD